MPLSRVKLVVTGTGRCGLGYVAEVLNRAGVPCGHEDVFTPYGISNKSWLVAESSWMAAPHLNEVPCFKLGVYRKRELVIDSFERLHIFDNGNVYGEYANKYGSSNATDHYDNWTKMVKDGSDLFVNIDSVSHNFMSKLLDRLDINYDPAALDIAFKNMPTNYNTGRNRV